MTDPHNGQRGPSKEPAGARSETDSPLDSLINTAVQAGQRQVEILAQAKIALLLVTLVLVLTVVVLFIAVIVLLLQL